MSQSLPLRDFEWVEQNELHEYFSDPDFILNLRDDADKGYIYGVDLNYPRNIHGNHIDFTPILNQSEKSRVRKYR